jgi:hypothetical protein
MRQASLVLAAAAIVAACVTAPTAPTAATSTNSPTPPTSGRVVQLTGTVHYYTFEGGFWAIRGDDGTTYDPVSLLPEQFQQEGLRVRLKATLRPDLASFHMAGPLVDIITIERL